MNLEWYHMRFRETNGKEYAPRVHGNGFIQVNIGLRDNPGDIRLHLFGDRRVPQQRNPTHIHDHNYSFISKVHRGRLINVVHRFWTSPGVYGPGTYSVHHAQARKGEDTELVKQGICLQREGVDVEIIEAGQTYKLEAFVFHESLAQSPTLTIMKKTSKNPGNNRVLVPVDGEPDNVFDRHTALDPEVAWSFILEAGGKNFEVHEPFTPRSWVRK